MNKKRLVIACLFLGLITPVSSASVPIASQTSGFKGTIAGMVSKIEAFLYRPHLVDLPAQCPDELKMMVDLLVSVREHTHDEDALYGLAKITPELFYEGEIAEIEDYLQGFIPESARFNATRLNNYRWALKGAFAAVTLLYGSQRYPSRESWSHRASYVVCIPLLAYVSYKISSKLLGVVFNNPASADEFLKKARKVLAQPFSKIPGRFYDFHRKYRKYNDEQLVAAFTSGVFVHDVIAELVPKGV